MHIALAEDGVITHSAVGMPDLGMVFSTSDVRRVDGPKTNRLVISRNSEVPVAEFIAEDLGMELIMMGSCGAKVVSVVLGDNDAYVHCGGQYEWDNAAPIGIAQAAGLHATRLDGTEFEYNQDDTYLPDLLVSRPDIAEKLLESAQRYKDKFGKF